MDGRPESEKGVEIEGDVLCVFSKAWKKTAMIFPSLGKSMRDSLSIGS